MLFNIARLDTSKPRPSWRTAHSAAALTCLAALLCAPMSLSAQSLEEVVKFNAVSTAQDSIPWMSGGIGEDARDEMRRMAANYNVHLTFSARHGEYLADIPFTVNSSSGKAIYAGVSAGPLLYLKLRPGSYRIAAKMGDAWQGKAVVVGSSGHSVRASFVATTE